MANRKITINRAPVLTLWATVVAERLEYERDSALSLGKAVAGLNAQSKGKALGIYSTPEGDGDAARKSEAELISLLGRPVPTIRTEAGLRAAIKGKQVEPEPVMRYLKGKFGDRLDEAWSAMASLAESCDQETLTLEAFNLYERFRPAIPKGKRGWGAKGDLDLELLGQLAAD